MTAIIHRAPQLQKCLQKLRKAGGRGALAAARIEGIITTLATQTGVRPAAVHKLTRHGEARIDHCKKFDLVGGYRLIYIDAGTDYYFLYAGTHDDCDHWLTHHRALKREPSGAPRRATAMETPAAPPARIPDPVADEMDYDAIVLKDLDEPMLRRVFRGLCGT